MNRYVLTMDLRDDPGVVTAYKEYHSRIWPEVAQSLTAAGVREMDIYLLDRRLVMVLELRDGLDPRQVFARHASSTPRVVEWEQRMRALQQPPPGAGEGEWWALMQPVCHLSAESNPDDADASQRVRTR